MTGIRLLFVLALVMMASGCSGLPTNGGGGIIIDGFRVVEEFTVGSGMLRIDSITADAGQIAVVGQIDARLYEMAGEVPGKSPTDISILWDLTSPEGIRRGGGVNIRKPDVEFSSSWTWFQEKRFSVSVRTFTIPPVRDENLLARLTFEKVS